MPLPTRRDRSTTFESLVRRGVKTLALDERTERICTSCGQPFAGAFLAELQTICFTCVESTVRLTEAEARQSRQEERRRRMLAIGLEGKLLGMTFATFSPSEQPAAYDSARSFLQDWPVDQGLALLGERGTGKTHLAAAILHTLSDAGEEGRYVHIPSLASDLAMAKDWQATASELFVPLYKAPLVVLDDAGRERTRPDSAWAQMLDTLIDRRSIGGYPTIICANLKKSELARWLGDAGASRFLSVATVIEMTPGDRRFSLPPTNPIPASMRDALVACAPCQGAGWVLDGQHRAGHVDRLRKCPSCDGRGY